MRCEHVSDDERDVRGEGKKGRTILVHHIDRQARLHRREQQLAVPLPRGVEHPVRELERFAREVGCRAWFCGWGIRLQLGGR
jgi:hypothetical protein